MTDQHSDLAGAKILLVDDQPANLDVLRLLLEAQGCKVLLAPSGQVALKNASRARPDLILLDVMMPGMDGYEVCARLKADPDTADIPVIFITARDLEDDVVHGFEAGAVDYVAKPFKDQEVLRRVRTHVHLHQLNRELLAKNEQLESEITRRTRLDNRLSMISQQEEERWGLEGFVGESPTIQRIFEEIRLMQENAATSVLIAGESGTGKELIARAIHFGGSRRDGPFVAVNCAAMPRGLAESQLFGHVRGAFTGAAADRPGHFELAHEGTLFLDEVGEMSLDLQPKLLRVLEDGEVWPVGAKAARQVDVRILAATNADLQQRLGEGSFRQDLYFRLARFTVTAPPLRQRQEDIPLLARHFLRFFAAEMGCEPPELSTAVLEALTSYPFPGNVRELKNVIERALIESRGGQILPRHLHFQLEGGGHEPPGQVIPALAEVPLDLDAAAAQAEMLVVRRAIEQCDGNVSAATRLLGTNRNRVYRILEQGKGSVLSDS
jgi:DNA-binding NtrC family response regulator